jgi:hypothetical protein
MKNITGAVALTVLVVGAGLVPTEASGDCKRGTVCRQLIEDGYKDCLRTIRDKWRGIRDQCKRAKAAHDPASCVQAIRDGYQATRTEAVAPVPNVACPPGYPVDCGNGTCCPSEFPICEPNNLCCSAAYPVPCGTFCCPSDYPICGNDGLCHQPAVTTTTTTMPTSCTRPPPPPSGCSLVGDTCSRDGCLGLPSGGCESHCSGGGGSGGFACIGYVASYSSCMSDADCPPADPALHDDTVCISTGYDPANPLGCSATYPGLCAQPCP